FGRHLIKPGINAIRSVKVLAKVELLNVDPFIGLPMDRRNVDHTNVAFAGTPNRARIWRQSLSRRFNCCALLSAIASKPRGIKSGTANSKRCRPSIKASSTGFPPSSLVKSWLAKKASLVIENTLALGHKGERSRGLGSTPTAWAAVLASSKDSP